MQKSGYITIVVLLVITIIAGYSNSMLQNLTMQHRVFNNINLSQKLDYDSYHQLWSAWRNLTIQQIETSRVTNNLTLQNLVLNDIAMNLELKSVTNEVFTLTATSNMYQPITLANKQVITFSSTMSLIYNPIWHKY